MSSPFWIWGHDSLIVDASNIRRPTDTASAARSAWIHEMHTLTVSQAREGATLCTFDGVRMTVMVDQLSWVRYEAGR